MPLMTVADALAAVLAHVLYFAIAYRADPIRDWKLVQAAVGGVAHLAEEELREARKADVVGIGKLFCLADDVGIKAQGDLGVHRVHGLHHKCTICLRANIFLSVLSVLAPDAGQ